MDFPTIDQVNQADHIQLCKWQRFLPSAGTEQERVVQTRIWDRYRENGGMTPEISKRIGWQ